jgi:hypothetical protein
MAVVPNPNQMVAESLIVAAVVIIGSKAIVLGIDQRVARSEGHSKFVKVFVVDSCQIAVPQRYFFGQMHIKVLFSQLLFGRSHVDKSILGQVDIDNCIELLHLRQLEGCFSFGIH